MATAPATSKPTVPTVPLSKVAAELAEKTGMTKKDATGALEDMLTNVSEFYDESIEAALQKLVNLIEPIILVVMGGVIATILLSIYLPMFSILSNIRS